MNPLCALGVPCLLPERKKCFQILIGMLLSLCCQLTDMRCRYKSTGASIIDMLFLRAWATWLTVRISQNTFPQHPLACRTMPIPHTPVFAGEASPASRSQGHHALVCPKFAHLYRPDVHGSPIRCHHVYIGGSTLHVSWLGIPGYSSGDFLLPDSGRARWKAGETDRIFFLPRGAFWSWMWRCVYLCYSCRVPLRLSDWHDIWGVWGVHHIADGFPRSSYTG